ncbi:MAG: hypothetical protein ABJM29_02795 [Rhizobiaceae bacterium]
MTRFSDAALLKGKFAHMAAELRAGQRTAPKQKDWNKASCDNQAEETAQEVAKHIFALQKSVDEKTEKLEILHFTSVGMMKVLAVVPGEGDVLRLDGVLENGNPVAQAMHASQLSLTFVKAPLKLEENEDDGVEIGFLIFDELTKRRKARDKRLRKLSLSATQKIPAKKKSRSAKKAAK